MIPILPGALVLAGVALAGCRGAPLVDPGPVHADTQAGDTQTPAPAPRPRKPEAHSLDGKPLFAPPLPEDIRAARQAAFDEARARHEADPTDVEGIVWYGRHAGYLGRYREAVAVFTDGLRIHPDSARLLRHRGHRFITLRRFDDAVADLERAAQLMAAEPDVVEADGLPNAAGVPTGTLYTNVWYHLGLAHYLRGDLARASEAWDACFDASTTDDMRVAATYWLVIALQRRGEHADAEAALARVPREPVLYENFAYERLLRLFRGGLDVTEALGGGTSDIDDATLGYGVAHWARQRGDRERAKSQLERVLQSPQWAAFGYIAAEVDLLAMA